MRERVARLRGLTGIGFRRVVRRLTVQASWQLLSAVLAVAFTIALMTTVSGIALGLASQSAVQSENVDYWVMPEGGSASSIAASVQGPKLGAVHDASARLAEDPRISHATPVQISLLRLTNATGGSEYVIALGVIPGEGEQAVAGLPTQPLTPGDPYYANGTYSGRWTGEVVVSDAAAQLLQVTQRDDVAIASNGVNRTLTVSRVARGDVQTGAGPVPVVLMHLAELQAVSGATQGDQADQLLVSTDSPGVKSYIERVYPGTSVVTRSGMSTQNVSTTSLPIAIALAAFVTAVVVGVLFVATMMGLEITGDRDTLAVLTAVGLTERSLSVFVLVETLSVTAVGGAIGAGLGVAGIEAVNAVSSRYLGVTPALFDPRLLAYGVVVALVIGVVAAVYPVWLYRRTPVTEVLN